MNLTQWRSDPSLTSAAKKLNTNKTYSTMMDLAKSHIMQVSTLPRTGNSEIDTAYNYGMIVGYWHCLAVIDAMSEYTPVQAEPVADFSETNDNPNP